MQWREMGREVRVGIGMFLLVTIFVVTSARSVFAQTETVTVNIPPQELSTALTALADQTNLQVLYASELASSQMTKGIAGTFTKQEAIQQLLEGSGLAFTFTDTKTVTLQKGLVPAGTSQVEAVGLSESPGRQKPMKVPEIVVKEVRERRYTADEASSATRIPAPIQDIPRSIEVVTRQVMDDQRVLRMQDALRNVSGTSMPNNTGGRGGAFMIRGFQTELNVFKNGFRDDFFANRASRDAANIEAIEVVKGPPSYLYGRADPGGVINQITKRPLKDPYYAGEMIFGSYNLYRPTMDIGGPLNETKTLLYRFNGVYESAQSFRDMVKSDRIFLAPTFGWEMGDRTTFRFEGEYLYDRFPVDRGIVAVGNGPANIPVSRFLGDASRKDEINQGKATLILLHQFNDMWKWRSAFRAADASENYNSLENWFLLPDDATLQLAAFKIRSRTQSYYLQNEVYGQFSTGPVKHRLLMGVELGREVSKAKSQSDSVCAEVTFTCTFNEINIYNPVYAFPNNNPLDVTGDSTTTNGILGLYFGDQLSLLDNLHVHAGGRFDIFEQKVVNRPSVFLPDGGEVENTDSAFSPSVGITYQPVKPIALFANYTQAFVPQSAGARNVQGTPFDPVRGRQYEAGVKFQAFEGNLRSTVAIFEITKRNVLTSDISQGPSQFLIATGEQQSQGVELDVAGRIRPGWDIIANYAYIDARITQDNTFAVNSRLDNVPLNQGSLWTTYFLQEGELKGLGFGVGMYAQSRKPGIKEVAQCPPGGFCQTMFELPGFVRMDAALYYRKQEIFGKTNLLAAVNFTNLLDQRYFTGTQDFRELVYPGAPLTVLASVKLEFN